MASRFALTAVTLAFAALGCEPVPPDLPARPPNIVFILVDDLGWADLPAYGNAFNEAPHIDRLAAEGMRFTNAYAAAPVCSPTRASIQSGQYPARIGITDFIPGHWRPYERLTVPRNRTQHLPLETITVAEALKSRGYATGYFGKWHLGSPGVTPANQGYDHGFYRRGGGHFNVGDHLVPPQEVDPEDNLTEVITEHSLAFMKEHRDGPFFLMISHYAVHIPLQAQQELIKKYEQKDTPAHGINNPIYAAMIEHVDQSVGEVLDGLDELEIAGNTVVLLYSDNGGLYERFDRSTGVIVTTNAPLRNEKGSLYEGGIRVPLIVRWPDAAVPGTTSGALVTSVDFYPTFAELAGMRMPGGQAFDGTSIVPLLQGGAQAPGRAVFFHYPHYHHSVPAGAIRKGDYKLIEFFDDGRAELYNLRGDIGEARNLAGELPDTAAAMQAQLMAWRDGIDAAMPTENPGFDETRRLDWGRHPDRR